MTQAAELGLHHQLLIDDAQQALTGLSAALNLQEQGLPQASLHARDLAVALRGAGLMALEPLASGLSDQLAQGQVRALFLARGLLPVLGSVLEQARQGAMEPAAQAQLAHWQDLLSRPEAQEMPAQAKADDLAQPASQPLAHKSLASAQTLAHGLLAIDRIRGELQSPHAQLAQIDARLSDLQNWLLNLGQYALSDLYPAPEHEVARAWADEAVLQMLKRSLDWAYRSRAIRGLTCGATLRLDWIGAELTPAEGAELAQQAFALDGRAETLPGGGWRLWLPASRQRMALQTYTDSGHSYAISAALLSTAAQPGERQLHLRTGTAEQVLRVDAAGEQATMNLYPIPASVPMPRRIAGVAVDGGGRLYAWVRPQAGN